MFKYKLVVAKTGELLTLGENNTVRFSGAWGDMQSSGQAIWIDNVLPLSEIKKQKLDALKSIATGLLSALDYNTLKFIDGALSVSEYAPIKAERQDIRDHYNILEEDVNSAESAAAVEAITW